MGLDDIEVEEDRGMSAVAFRERIAAIHETQQGLAKRMRELGDSRPFSTVLRGVQRMATGDTRVSGEMQVILSLLAREVERQKAEVDALTWEVDAEGAVRTKSMGFTITMYPERSGYRIYVREETPDGYCAPWPRFPQGIEAAKLKAMETLHEAIADLKIIRKETSGDTVGNV
jgi:hypothetical protein